MTQIEILEIAFDNSYKVIILDYDWEEIMDEEHPFFAHNPARLVPRKENVQALLSHFKLKEQYRKCQAIHNYIIAMS